MTIDNASVGDITLDPEPQPTAYFKAVLYNVFTRRIVKEINVELTFWTDTEKRKATTPFEMFIPCYVVAPKTWNKYVFLMWKYDNVEVKNNVIYADKETTYYAYYFEAYVYEMLTYIMYLLWYLIPLFAVIIVIALIGKTMFGLLKKKKRR